MVRFPGVIGAALALVVLATASVPAQQVAGLQDTKRIVVEGRGVRVLARGLESRAQGQPVVLFEAGATNSLEVWSSVLQQLTPDVPIVAYDRAGLGQSEWDHQTPSPKHVVERFRRILATVGAAPPYVLVGYSWGGSLMRYFAGYHPGEVAGLVYVDPGPIVTQSKSEELAPFDSIGAGRAGYEAFWSGYAALLERAAPAVRAEFDVFRGLMQQELVNRDLRPAPDVPTVIILAAKPFPSLPNLPFNPERHFAADLRHRIRKLQEWALGSSDGTLVVSKATSHAVPREEPQLIVWAIQRVLAAAATGRQ